MSEFMQGVFDLLSQLIEIGSTHTEVLIATMAIAAGSVITCVLFCITVVISIPFVIIRGLFGLVKWLYYLKHPQLIAYPDYDDEEDEPPVKPARNRVRKSKESSESQELDPVLPHWMNQKGGRLL